MDDQSIGLLPICVAWVHIQSRIIFWGWFSNLKLKDSKIILPEATCRGLKTQSSDS